MAPWGHMYVNPGLTEPFEKEAAGRFPVEVINMVDYGRMNAAGIIDHCVSVMG